MNTYILQSVKQGDPLSYSIFNCVLQEIFSNMNRGGNGIKINGQWLNYLRFADDIILYPNSDLLVKWSVDL